MDALVRTVITAIIAPGHFFAGKFLHGGSLQFSFHRLIDGKIFVQRLFRRYDVLFGRVYFARPRPSVYRLNITIPERRYGSPFFQRQRTADIFSNTSPSSPARADASAEASIASSEF